MPVFGVRISESLARSGAIPDRLLESASDDAQGDVRVLYVGEQRRRPNSKPCCEKPRIATAAAGAAKIVQCAFVDGYADKAIQRDRALRCASCHLSKAIGSSIWCGEPLRDRRAASSPTCGCKVAERHNGVVVPKGKTKIAREQCPSGFWPSVERAQRHGDN